MSAPLIEISCLSKIYNTGAKPLEVLKRLTLTVNQGDFLAIMGPSGSGKSTLLNILGCLDRLSSGRYLLEHKDISCEPDDALSSIRAGIFGFIFQNFNLIPNMTVYDNVSMPFLYSGTGSGDIHEKSMTAIDSVGLAKRIHHKPGELSGGEMQRVAIARAIVKRPKIILADEPTGNLDSATGRAIMDIIKALNTNGTTIILVTHDVTVASWSQTVKTLKDGKFI